MSYKEDLKEVQSQAENARAIFTKLQGIIEYLEAKIAQEEEKNVANEDKKVVKKKQIVLYYNGLLQAVLTYMGGYFKYGFISRCKKN